jgi:thiamine pyrophosphokinase
MLEPASPSQPTHTDTAPTGKAHPAEAPSGPTTPGVNGARSHTDVVVIGGGAPPPQALRALLPPADDVICADRGYAHALDLGLTPTVLTGDFDSLDRVDLDRARAAGVSVEAHSPEKDATDLELALDRAVTGHAGELRITVVATPDVGERIDHLLSQLALLAAPKYAHAELLAWFGSACVQIVHPARTVAIHGRPGELVTLLAIGGVATGVTTTGLDYPLRDEPLSPFSTRGVSNVLSDTSAAISVTGGCLAIVRPHALEDHS